VISRVGTVFHKIRTRNNHFVAGIADSLKHRVQSARRSDRHDDTRAVNGNLMFPRGFAGKGFPRVGKTGVGHIAVGAFFVFFGKFQKNPVKFRRRFKIGIPQ